MAEAPAPERDINQYISLIGVRNTERMDTYFASSMVDVACVVAITSNIMKVVPDVGIDLSKQEDVNWLTEIVRIALSECDEVQATIEIHQKRGRI